MRTRTAAAGVLALATMGVAWALGVGERVEPFTAKDEAGKSQSLSDHQGKVVVLVVWGSACRSSEGYAQRLEALARHAKSQKAVFLGLAPNAADDAATVAAAKQRQALSFPIIIDQGARIARLLGAQVTPTAIVIDGNGVLRYRGAIDDDPAGARGSAATQHLKLAIDAVVAGQDPPRTETRPAGSPIR
jgi:peroxiredoxin